MAVTARTTEVKKADILQQRGPWQKVGDYRNPLNANKLLEVWFNQRTEDLYIAVAHTDVPTHPGYAF